MFIHNYTNIHKKEMKFKKKLFEGSICNDAKDAKKAEGAR